VIETTGLADPGPVAQTFFMDDEIAESYLLDSILTLVDAKHADSSSTRARKRAARSALPTRSSSARPTWCAAGEADALAHRIKHMNPRAPQRGALRRGADRRGVRPAGFNLNAKLDIDPDFLKEEATARPHHDHDHDHDGPRSRHGRHCDHPHHHAHDDDVKSFVFKLRPAFNPAKLEDFLGAIVQVYGPKMLRYKGVLHMKGSDRKVVFQGVHQLMGSDLGPKWAPGEKSQQDGLHRHRPARTCCCRAWNSASCDVPAGALAGAWLQSARRRRSPGAVAGAGYNPAVLKCRSPGVPPGEEKASLGQAQTPKAASTPAEGRACRQEVRRRPRRRRRATRPCRAPTRPGPHRRQPIHRALRPATSPRQSETRTAHGSREAATKAGPQARQRLEDQGRPRPDRSRTAGHARERVHERQAARVLPRPPAAQKDDLLSNAGETTEHLREDTTIVPDPADRATIEEEHALELRTRDRERKLLKKIAQSLARLDSGDYGFCDETGEPIGLGACWRGRRPRCRSRRSSGAS
jgi:RNA polymerase-binding protein DksA